MTNQVFARRIYSLQNAIVWELNDAHIFLEQALAPLLEAKTKYENSGAKKDRRYYVPSVNRTKFAKRTDKELRDIYDHYISTGLFEAFLVNSLSRFEGFLADVLLAFFSHYPLRITERVQGIPACPDIAIKDLLTAPDKHQLEQRVFSEHLSNVFRQRPSAYMACVSTMLGVKEEPLFADYYEISATRDLVVHNSRLINQLYLDKAGPKVRGALGQTIAVDKAYLYEALAKMKKISGVIKRDVEKAYGGRTESV